MDDLVQKASGSGRSIMGSQDVADEMLQFPDMDAAPLAEQLKYAGEDDLDRILSKYIEGLGEGAAQSIMMANYLFVEIMMAASRMIRDHGGF